MKGSSKGWPRVMPRSDRSVRRGHNQSFFCIGDPVILRTRCRAREDMRIIHSDTELKYAATAVPNQAAHLRWLSIHKEHRKIGEDQPFIRRLEIEPMYYSGHLL